MSGKALTCAGSGCWGGGGPCGTGAEAGGAAGAAALGPFWLLNELGCCGVIGVLGVGVGGGSASDDGVGAFAFAVEFFFVGR
jgi:hypothetical protein